MKRLFSSVILILVLAFSSCSGYATMKDITASPGASKPASSPSAASTPLIDSTHTSSATFSPSASPGATLTARSSPATSSTVKPTAKSASTPKTATSTESSVKPAAISTPAPTAETHSSIVYVTNTGKKYHRSGCGSLNKSKIEISLSDAKTQGYTACKVCKP